MSGWLVDSVEQGVGCRGRVRWKVLILRRLGFINRLLKIGKLRHHGIVLVRCFGFKFILTLGDRIDSISDLSLNCGLNQIRYFQKVL